MNDRAHDARLRRDVPVASTGDGAWGSDAIAAMLRDMEIPYVVLNPGVELPRAARQPRQLPRQRAAADAALPARGARRRHRARLREGHRQPLLAVVHSNVGLMHASMADLQRVVRPRAGAHASAATGPVDAARRRPWIDWIHTARDQAALVRGFVKWDDQPASVGGGVRIAAACAADRADGAVSARSMSAWT